MKHHIGSHKQEATSHHYAHYTHYTYYSHYAYDSH